MKVLYVTSFAKDMYVQSGQKLLNSWLNHLPCEKLLVCYENFDFLKKYPKAVTNGTTFLTYPLHESDYLKTWLKDNEDVIPDYLGGKATKESHPHIFAKTHNRKASRWFRKVASLEYAVNHYGKDYDAIVWIDADCVINRPLPSNHVQNVLKNSQAFYHFGPIRKQKDICFESGIIGFRNPLGYELLKKVIERYRDRSYMKYKRWDDGFVFRKVFEENPQISQRDLVQKPRAGDTAAIKYGPFAKFITHNKGLHRRKKILI